VVRRPRIPRAPAIAPVTWRDGIHLTHTSIWCDARRRRDVCFVSSADRVGRTGHGQLIGTPLTLALLGTSDGNLAVPLRQRFTLGTLRLELVASGRGPGAAALFVDPQTQGKKVLYAGAVRPYDGTRVTAADVRACDVLVVDAPFGATKRKFPALDGVIDKTLAWVRAQLAANRRPILLVDTALDGLEVATVLAAEGFALAGAKPIRDAAARMGETSGQTVLRKKTTNGTSGRSSKTTPAIAAPSRELRPTIWLDAHRDAPAIVTDNPHGTALISGRPLGDSSATEIAFAWPSAADRPALLEWIEETRAKEIFVTGACAAQIVAALGDKARVLGPPEQLTLFAETA
jgi:hypothetical protein